MYCISAGSININRGVEDIMKVRQKIGRNRFNPWNRKRAKV